MSKQPDVQARQNAVTNTEKKDPSDQGKLNIGGLPVTFFLLIVVIVASLLMLIVKGLGII